MQDNYIRMKFEVTDVLERFVALEYFSPYGKVHKRIPLNMNGCKPVSNFGRVGSRDAVLLRQHQ
jgi:hypothetical protein